MCVHTYVYIHTYRYIYIYVHTYMYICIVCIRRLLVLVALLLQDPVEELPALAPAELIVSV